MFTHETIVASLTIQCENMRNLSHFALLPCINLCSPHVLSLKVLSRLLAYDDNDNRHHNNDAMYGV